MTLSLPRRGRGRPLGARARNLVARHVDALARVHLIAGQLAAAGAAGDKPRASRLRADLEDAAVALTGALSALDAYLHRRRQKSGRIVA